MALYNHLFYKNILDIQKMWKIDLLLEINIGILAIFLSYVRYKNITNSGGGILGRLYSFTNSWCYSQGGGINKSCNHI